MAERNKSRRKKKWLCSYHLRKVRTFVKFNSRFFFITPEILFLLCFRIISSIPFSPFMLDTLVVTFFFIFYIFIHLFTYLFIYLSIYLFTIILTSQVPKFTGRYV